MNLLNMTFLSSVSGLMEPRNVLERIVSNYAYMRTAHSCPCD